MISSYLINLSANIYRIKIIYSSVYFHLQQESLIDSRFNLFSAGFKRQFDDLNNKVDKLVANQTEDIGRSNDPFKKEANKASSKSPKFCENSSSFCNFYYPDHPDSGRKKGQHSPTVTNEMLADPSKVKGMPKNCADLQLLGHKLNGLYLVKASRPNQGTKIDTVFCDFKLPFGVAGNKTCHKIKYRTGMF